MNTFPRTEVSGVSLPRLIIGTNWFLGYSHTSQPKDEFIKSYQTRARLCEILTVFLEAGIDAVLAPVSPFLESALQDAEQQSGRRIIRILTPHFNILPGGAAENEPAVVFDRCRELGATFCLPHQCITDVILDRLHQEIRGMAQYSQMIRERGMIPGLSTHLPETVMIADKTNADVATYIQLYNALGFLMPIEVDWAMRIISLAKKPVLTIKPLAAGRLIPPVGLAFVWNTLRDQDLVSVGTTTPDEAREVIELSLDFLERRLPANDLQTTRSKKSLL
ncbi:hypothetical protein L0128_08475 [candidate division KSB1 bacterium]|nr:hypothetical protein [candidate division KSB1 bacterium]